MTEAFQKIFSATHFTVRHTSAIEPTTFEAHSHSYYTVTVLLSGRMQITIGENHFAFGRGQTTFTNAHQTHAASGAEFEFVSIGISPTLINELVTELGLTRNAAEIVFHSSLVTDDSITTTVRSIAGEIAQEKIGHQEMLETLVRQLVIHLLRSHLTVRKSAQIELSRAGLVDRRLRRAIEFMHDNFGRELALEEIAAAAYLSEFHFARLFKQLIGATPHAYLANLRIERARKLLAETSIPIIEIAAMVGYQSQSHFTKIFKSVTGLTPRSYRESH
ncbi:MAG: helix-turn-helix domain-containing protein [Acidobacteriota bacterium]